MIVTMVFLPVVAAGLIWLAAGSSVMARFEGHNQADRAAYSMSAQLASELNELSVLNRKILASHLMVGHLTTYLSFTRYLRDMLQKVGYLVPFGSNIITGGTTLLGSVCTDSVAVRDWSRSGNSAQVGSGFR